MQRADTLTSWSTPPQALVLQPDHVDVWRLSLDLPVATVKFLESALSEDESRRAARFYFPADRVRYTVAHGCLRDILARYLHCNPDQLRFSGDDFGKPALHDRALEFNLSHSGDIALIALTPGPKVGIDVERIRPDLEIEPIAYRNFSEIEVVALTAIPPEQRLVAFFNCWTRKEAYIKAQGLGLSLSLDSFDVSLVPGQPAKIHATRPDEGEAARWTLQALNIDPGYAAAVAVQGRGLAFRFWEWSSDK